MQPSISDAATDDEIANRYLFFQRTLYLENILSPGNWWANPALLSKIETRTILTSNVAPLAGKYVIASARALFPITEYFKCGVGILGTGLYEKTSQTNTTIDGRGVSTSGSFSFDRPSLQFGIAGNLPYLGSVGGLTAFGFEEPRDLQRSQRSFIWSIGGGVISPLFFNMTGFSISYMATGIINVQSRWYHDGKLGMHFSFNDDFIRAMTSFSFTANSSLGLWNQQSGDYQVFKTMVSIRTLEILGTLVGMSSDLENFGPLSDLYDKSSVNGNCIHLGLELRKTDYSPYFGGLDMGISITNPGHIFVRFWFGYEFADSSPDTTS
ncbi:MAG: hypothetical protein GF401_17805 [Chitinivibrionales bacterium]|nr:hypothetical protein [Chitinivibrionales bacterium]